MSSKISNFILFSSKVLPYTEQLKYQILSSSLQFLSLVISPILCFVDSFKKEINEKMSEKSNKQTKAIENLTKENGELREQIAGQRKKMSEIQKQVADNEIISKEALQMSNYNQQYSRKFNIKIMNYPENKDEKIRDIFGYLFLNLTHFFSLSSYLFSQLLILLS
jgi:hypothetical protein